MSGREKPPSVKVADNESDTDVVEEDIVVSQSDAETPSPYTGGKRGDGPELSLSESCTEVSISDRRLVSPPSPAPPTPHTLRVAVCICVCESFCRLSFLCVCLCPR